MKNKNTKSAYLKRARASLKGLVLFWSDEFPLMEGYHKISETGVNHKNPTQKLICQDMWRRCQKFIVESDFTWHVSVKLIYTSTRDRMDKVDIGVFRKTCAIRGRNNAELDTAIEAFIIESRLNNNLVGDDLGQDHKSFGVFQRAEFTATIVGV